MSRDKPIVTMDQLKKGDVVRPVDYDNEYFFDMLVVENDKENKKVRFNRPHARISTHGQVYALLEDWWLPYREGVTFYLLTSNIMD